MSTAGPLPLMEARRCCCCARKAAAVAAMHVIWSLMRWVRCAWGLGGKDHTDLPQLPHPVLHQYTPQEHPLAGTSAPASTWGRGCRAAATAASGAPALAAPAFSSR